MSARLSGAVWQVRTAVRRLPARARFGAVIAVIALAGLAWDHHSHTRVTTPPAPVMEAAARAHDDYGDEPTQQQRPAPTVAPHLASLEAAHTVAQRFATNFARPTSNRDDWLTRIGADVSTQLREQYQLTDIRTITRAAVTALAGPLDAVPGAVAFRATYSDGTQIQMHLALDIDGWKIVDVIPLPT